MARVQLPPGFRFHPTDVELVWYYLRRKVLGKGFRFEAIAEVELYKFAPWDLPEKSLLRNKDLEWYFFVPRDRKYANGSRTNRATEIGYWKTTGRDRSIVLNVRTVGMKKTLIFYLGKAPGGTRTDWVMYEYKLEDKGWANTEFSQDAYVLCKIFQKSGPGPKAAEQYGAPFKDEDWEDDTDIENAFSFPFIRSSDCTSVDNQAVMLEPLQSVAFEVGESSSKLQFDQAAEPSLLPELSEVGEPSCMAGLSYADGIYLRHLEELLNSSPAHPENADGKVLDLYNLCEVANEEPAADVEGVYGGLDDLSVRLGLEPIEDVCFSGSMCQDYSLQPALTEYAGDGFIELDDFCFVRENDPLGLGLVFSDDSHDPFNNLPDSSGFSDNHPDSSGLI